MFNYILEYPRVVRRALGDLLTGAIGGPHLICSFLSGMVRCFSVYYRRVRILDVSVKILNGHFVIKNNCTTYILNVYVDFVQCTRKHKLFKIVVLSLFHSTTGNT